MTVANLGRQHQSSLDSYFKGSSKEEKNVFVWDYKLLFRTISIA